MGKIYKKSNKYYRDRMGKLRSIALNKYGNKCNCCGEKEKVFLCIDHIYGGGQKHRRDLKFANIYEWLRKEDYPSGFQILCYNCNNAKNVMVCPHKSYSLDKVVK